MVAKLRLIQFMQVLTKLISKPEKDIGLIYRLDFGKQKDMQEEQLMLPTVSICLWSNHSNGEHLFSLIKPSMPMYYLQLFHGLLYQWLINPKFSGNSSNPHHSYTLKIQQASSLHMQLLASTCPIFFTFWLREGLQQCYTMDKMSLFWE